MSARIEGVKPLRNDNDLVLMIAALDQQISQVDEIVSSPVARGENRVQALLDLDAMKAYRANLERLLKSH